MADGRLVSGIDADGEEKGHEEAAFGDVTSQAPRTRDLTRAQTTHSTRDFADYATAFTLGLLATDRQPDRGRVSL